eukprot:364376-Chlamydomonas_euryale.AAC.2
MRSRAQQRTWEVCVEGICVECRCGVGRARSVCMSGKTLVSLGVWSVVGQRIPSGATASSAVPWRAHGECEHLYLPQAATTRTGVSTPIRSSRHGKYPIASGGGCECAGHAEDPLAPAPRPHSQTRSTPGRTLRRAAPQPHGAVV